MKSAFGKWLVGNGRFNQILFSAFAAVFSLLIGAIVIFLAGYSPIAAYAAMFHGAFGGSYYLSQTLAKTTPLIFTGLAFSFAAKARQFNIGLEGQLYVGALTSALAGIYITGLPIFIHLPLALAAGALAGGMWSLIPGILKIKTGANEIIITVMLNFIAILLTGYLVSYPFLSPGETNFPQTAVVAVSAQLPNLLPPSQLSAAIFLALLCAVVIYFVLEKTVLGYELKASGLSPLAAEDAGISMARNIFLAMLVSGAIAGLGGAGEVLGLHKRFISDFSPGYGWTGIAVGILGRHNSFGIVVAAFVFGALMQGGMVMMRVTHIPLELYLVIQAVIIITAAAPELGRWLLILRRTAVRFVSPIAPVESKIELEKVD
ncbi:MAG: ABC transporter permease [Chloroflexi bacterium]|nr:ABC transporter permease [Chloroflexota bacterium]MCL5074295.1 ABC transporter permease [Chloroflexota bacterium]